ncbi:MAG: carbon monoxide dehydrogenase subunit G [Chloroflexota bacterium]|nr:carbon monoxide dehydrogenase subunit G [Chloroflexota bacterium]
MKVEGSYTMNGARQQVYDTLSEPAALRQCLPGCEKFEEVGEGRYETVLKAGVAGVKGTFTGTVTLADQRPPEAYTLSVEGNFSGGFVKGVGQITLEEDGDKTKVKYSGDGQVGGPLASVGQRLMVPAARMVVNQFFKCMDGQLQRGGSETGASARAGADD